jgi:hypothetical protein
VQGVDQAHHSGVHQVFEWDVPRQMLMDAARNVAYLWKLIHQQPFSLRLILPRRISFCAQFHCHFLLRF